MNVTTIELDPTKNVFQIKPELRDSITLAKVPDVPHRVTMATPRCTVDDQFTPRRRRGRDRIAIGTASPCWSDGLVRTWRRSGCVDRAASIVAARRAADGMFVASGADAKFSPPPGVHSNGGVGVHD